MKGVAKTSPICARWRRVLERKLAIKPTLWPQLHMHGFFTNDEAWGQLQLLGKVLELSLFFSLPVKPSIADGGVNPVHRADTDEPGLFWHLSDVHRDCTLGCLLGQWRTPAERRPRRCWERWVILKGNLSILSFSARETEQERQSANHHSKAEH